MSHSNDASTTRSPSSSSFSRILFLPRVYLIAAAVLVLVSSSLVVVFRPSLYLAAQQQQQPTMSPHVVVVGGGLAGLSAAVEALSQSSQNGARVTLLDKSRLGGNSAKATSGMNAVLTRHQREAGVTDDSHELFVADIARSGKGKSDLQLAKRLSLESASAVDFLESHLGRELSDIAILGGHSRPRTHRLHSDGTPMPIGFLVTTALKKRLLADERVSVMEEARLVDIVTDEEGGSTNVKSIQVKYGNGSEAAILHPSALVLATGGFAADLSEGGLTWKYGTPSSKGYPFTTNGGFATGDLLKLCIDKLGADTVDLDEVQLHPTSFVDPKNPAERQKWLCPEVMRGVGGLLINKEGRRFVSEIETRDTVSAAILKHGSDIQSDWGIACETDLPRAAMLLMNEEVREKVGAPFFDFYMKRGLIQKHDTVDSLSSLNVETLKQQLQKYADAASQTTPIDEFGKTVFPSTKGFSEGAIYTALVTPAIHYTMGGVRTDAEARILVNGRPTANIFAAGELTGGLHGANRLGGNGMLESVVFGRIAGRSAAAATKDTRCTNSSASTVATCDETQQYNNESTNKLE